MMTTRKKTIKRKERKMVARKETGIKITRKVELMAADFLAARGYAIFDARLAAQMLALVSKNN